MIRIACDLLAINVRAPLGATPDQGKQFLVMGWPPLFSFVEQPAFKAYRPVVLTQDATNMMVRTISDKLKRFGEIWNSQSGCVEQHLFCFFKSLLSLLRPDVRSVFLS